MSAAPDPKLLEVRFARKRARRRYDAEKQG